MVFVFNFGFNVVNQTSDKTHSTIIEQTFVDESKTVNKGLDTIQTKVIPRFKAMPLSFYAAWEEAERQQEVEALYDLWAAADKEQSSTDDAMWLDQLEWQGCDGVEDKLTVEVRQEIDALPVKQEMENNEGPLKERSRTLRRLHWMISKMPWSTSYWLTCLLRGTKVRLHPGKE